jgi:putative transposase
MPNHFHLLITPTEALERAIQCVKGGFSYRAKKELGFVGNVWQPSYYDHRIRDFGEYCRCAAYIRENPVRKRLCELPDQFPYSSACPALTTDEVPRRLKPLSVVA